MKVALFGATGFSGAEVLRSLLDQGHTVTALVRNAGKLSLSHPQLIPLTGNVLKEKDLRRTLQGQDAALNCLGIGGKGNGKPNSFVSEATQKIVQVIEEQGVSRFIAMSNVGAGESAAFQPWFFRKLILPYFMKWLQYIIDDKNRMEPIIHNSNLKWTIVRCPNIIEKPAKGSARPSLDGRGLKLSITNPDLAQFLVDQLTNPTFLLQSPCISN